MTKHTPGPWKYGKELSARSGEWLISMDVGERGRGMQIAETRTGSGHENANARLIAAAPDLLNALTVLADACERMDIPVDAARAAIAKARGE